MVLILLNKHQNTTLYCIFQFHSGALPKLRSKKSKLKQKITLTVLFLGQFAKLKKKTVLVHFK